MKIKQFYRTQRDLAYALNELVDFYWADGINDEELTEAIKDLHDNNPGKLCKGDEFTKVVQQQCGKRRLLVAGKVLGISS